MALKRLLQYLAVDANFEPWFRRESPLTARLWGTNIISIDDIGEIGGGLFLDMPLVKGTDLITLLTQDGVLTLVKLTKTLDAAHADSALHRDVKPSNALCTATAGSNYIVYKAELPVLLCEHSRIRLADRAT